MVIESSVSRTLSQNVPEGDLKLLRTGCHGFEALVERGTVRRLENESSAIDQVAVLSFILTCVRGVGHDWRKSIIFACNQTRTA